MRPQVSRGIEHGGVPRELPAVARRIDVGERDRARLYAIVVEVHSFS
jgi:hypothetical protein